MSQQRILLVGVPEIESQELVELFSNEGWLSTFSEDLDRGSREIDLSPVDLVIASIHGDVSEQEPAIRDIKAKIGDSPIVLIVDDPDFDPDEAAYFGVLAVFKHPVEEAALITVVRRLLEPEDIRQKRKSDRIPCDFPIILREKVTRQMVTSRVLNLGDGGLFVAHSGGDLPKRFDTFSFAFRIEPEGTEVTGKGVVRWVQKTVQPLFPIGFGIEFFEIDGDGRSDIVDWIRTQKKRNSDDS